MQLMHLSLECSETMMPIHDLSSLTIHLLFLYILSPKNHLSKHWVDERLSDICFRDEVDLGDYILFSHFILSFCLFIPFYHIHTIVLKHLGSPCLQNGTCGVRLVGSKDPSQVFLNLVYGDVQQNNRTENHQNQDPFLVFLNIVRSHTYRKYLH